MSNPSIQYYISGVKQTFLTRILPTKTFKLASAAVLTSLLMAVEGQITWQAFLATSYASVFGILIRSALSKVQLSNDAANPDLPTVEAIETRKVNHL